MVRQWQLQLRENLHLHNGRLPWERCEGVLQSIISAAHYIRKVWPVNELVGRKRADQRYKTTLYRKQPQGLCTPLFAKTKLDVPSVSWSLRECDKRPCCSQRCAQRYILVSLTWLLQAIHAILAAHARALDG